MILRKILAETENPSDVLQLFIFYVTLKTVAKGGFVSVATLDYMDVVIGSMRRRRSSLAKDGVSVSNIKLLNVLGKGESYLFNDIFIYKSSVGWYVGLDSPELNQDRVIDIIEAEVNTVYPVYSLLSKRELDSKDRDELTGCLTRPELFKQLKSNLKTMLTKDLPLFVFYMDFNNFKVVNDTLGHNFGDEVLRSVAGEIRSVFLGYGNVYRVGGDEFIGVAFGISEDLADRIARRIELATRQSPCGLFVSVSVAYKRFSKDIYLYTIDSDMHKVLNKYIADVEAEMYENKRKFHETHNTPKVMCDLCPHNQKL